MSGFVVAAAEPLRPAMLDALRAFATVRYAPEAWRSCDEVARTAADASVLLTRTLTRVDRALLDRLPALGCVAVYGAGREHLELPALDDREIRLIRCSAEVAGTIAEFTLGLALCLLRRLPEAAAATAAGGWRTEGLFGHDLAGRRVLVVGCGPIGERTARLFAAVGASVTVARRSDRPLPAALTAAGCRVGGLRESLTETQLVTLHVPGGEGTRRLLGRRELALLPDGAHVINTSRGSVLDLDALLAELRSGRLGGAALDVLPTEPPAQPLPSLPGLVVTPHLALYSHEAVDRRIAAVAGQVRDWLRSAAAAQARS
jgi:D-3-phosphoglycerate dehydrogenase